MNDNKVINIEDHKLKDPEDVKKISQKKKEELERKKQNDQVLRNYSIGKYSRDKK